MRLLFRLFHFTMAWSDVRLLPFFLPQQIRYRAYLELVGGMERVLDVRLYELNNRFSSGVFLGGQFSFRIEARARYCINEWG